MNAGVADQISAPLEVYANPSTAFVAGFIGSPPTNFLDADLLGETGEAKQIGIRPEHVRIADTGRITAHVGYAEALGAETLVHLWAKDRTQITIRQAAAQPIPTEGSEASLDWDEPYVMRFDSAGERLRHRRPRRPMPKARAAYPIG